MQRAGEQLDGDATPARLAHLAAGFGAAVKARPAWLRLGPWLAWAVEVCLNQFRPVRGERSQLTAMSTPKLSPASCVSQAFNSLKLAFHKAVISQVISP